MDCKGNSPAVVPVKADSTTETLPEGDLVLPLVADQREPRASARYENYNSETDDFNAGAVSLGDSYPVANILNADGSKIQFGMEAGIFALFNFDADSTDLINTDFLFGIPVTYQNGPWSIRGRIYHQSSHLGDEFLLSHPEVERVNLSYEETNVLLSYQWKWFRVYGGGGAIVRSEPHLDPWHVQGGAEVRVDDFISDLDLIAGVDFQAKDELDWDWSQSYLVGVGLNKFNERELRIMTGYYDGFSPNGQFFHDEVSYWSFGLYYDL